jgi:hypothetical protein
MEEAINGKSTDLVGLGRPLCAEPYLCKELIVRSSKKGGYCGRWETDSNSLKLGGHKDRSKAKLLRHPCHDASCCSTDPRHRLRSTGHRLEQQGGVQEGSRAALWRVGTQAWQAGACGCQGLKTRIAGKKLYASSAHNSKRGESRVKDRMSESRKKPK